MSPRRRRWRRTPIVPAVLVAAGLAWAAIEPAAAPAAADPATYRPRSGEGLPQVPVGGAVVREFEPPDPDWLPGHRGLDLAAAPGEPVVNPRAGVVVRAGDVAGVPVVVVQHGQARATYQPVRSELRPGAPVAAGAVLGRLATVGGHCAGRCLHWGLIVSQRYADPRLLLGRVRVRLIPDQG